MFLFSYISYSVSIWFICFQDFALEEVKDDKYGHVFTGNILTRYCLVLDCFVAHEYNSTTADLINLQHHVTEKKLSEQEAIKIFYSVVKVVKNLHAVSKQYMLT